MGALNYYLQESVPMPSDAICMQASALLSAFDSFRLPDHDLRRDAQEVGFRFRVEFKDIGTEGPNRKP